MCVQEQFCDCFPLPLGCGAGPGPNTMAGSNGPLLQLGSPDRSAWEGEEHQGAQPKDGENP